MKVSILYQIPYLHLSDLKVSGNTVHRSASLCRMDCAVLLRLRRLNCAAIYSVTHAVSTEPERGDEQQKCHDSCRNIEVMKKNTKSAIEMPSKTAQILVQLLISSCL